MILYSQSVYRHCRKWRRRLHASIITMYNEIYEDDSQACLLMLTKKMLI
jgi:hypothetical protein